MQAKYIVFCWNTVILVWTEFPCMKCFLFHWLCAELVLVCFCSFWTNIVFFCKLWLWLWKIPFCLHLFSVTSVTLFCLVWICLYVVLSARSVLKLPAWNAFRLWLSVLHEFVFCWTSTVLFMFVKLPAWNAFARRKRAASVQNWLRQMFCILGLFLVNQHYRWAGRYMCRGGVCGSVN